MPDLYYRQAERPAPFGAGQTTTALRIFPAPGVANFINADIIAQGISPLDADKAARAAGRLMLREMNSHFADRWSVWENSGDWSVEVANGTFGKEILRPDTWEIIST